MLRRVGPLGSLALLAWVVSCDPLRSTEPFEPAGADTAVVRPVIRPAPIAPKGIVLWIDFESFPLGTLDVPHLRALLPEVGHAVLPSPTRVVEDAPGNRVLEAHLPAGAVGPSQGGVTFMVSLPEYHEYRLSYRVWASRGFDFGHGGKLPGLCSGGDTYSGGVIPVDGDGWTARFTWGPTGSLSLYVYHVGMEGPWGHTMPTTGRIIPGRWHLVTQQVRINRNGHTDGRIAAGLDDVLVFERHDLELRHGDLGRIDSICFSNFHGGSGIEFAPSRPSVMRFDDVVVTIPDEPDCRA